MSIRPTLRAAVLCALFLFYCAAALGCGACMAAQLDHGFPVYWWSGLAASWYLLTAATRTITGIATGTSGVIAAAIYTLIAFAVSATMFGPIPFLILGVVAGIAWIRICSRELTSETSKDKKALMILKVTGLVFLAAFIATFAVDKQQKASFRTADWINRWSGTIMGRTLIRNLEKEGKTALPELRDVVARCANFEAVSAAKILLDTGDPNIDIPLTIDLLRRTENQRWVAQDVRETLSKTTGLTLPDTAAPEIWEAKWRASLVTSGTLATTSTQQIH